MPITNDLTLNVSKFRRGNISEATQKANTTLEHITTSGPRWFDIGIAKFRAMRKAGETPLPPPPSKGVYIHFHGGGFILGTEKHADSILQSYANACQLTAIAVGYRLAPEDPYPAAVHDSIDAAEYLADHAEKEYGAQLRFIGGESAGATLAAVSVLQLMRSRRSFRLAGVVLMFGWYDLMLGLPASATATRPLLINFDTLDRFRNLYLPGMGDAEMRDPSVSPLYEEFQALAAGSPAGSLPPAIFVCGTEDPLLDDTVLMGMRWAASSEDTVVKIYPGAAHGFTLFPGLSVAEEANAVMLQWIREKLDLAV